MDQDYDYLFKVLVIGDSSVGKTSTLLRYVDNKFNPEFQTTIGVDFKVNTFMLNGKSVKLQLWDTAGQDRFRNIVASYYRGAQGIILMYDITSLTSFQSIKKWQSEAQSYLQASVPKLLVGNKLDLSSQRQVSVEDAQDLADSLGMEYIETSAKSAQNVKEAFMKMSEKMLEQSSSKQVSSSAPVGTKLTERKKVKKGCCG